MAPDINPQDVQQNPKYPNDEQVWQWGNEFANQWLRGQQSTLTREQYVARKACDWMREQDAQLCEVQKTPVSERVDHFYNVGCDTCASAIRSGGSHAD